MGALGVDAQRKPRAPREAETARAPRPVDAPHAAADARLTTRRDQPVGPPPAFAINVLQHLRETAFDPPEPDAPEPEAPAEDTPPRREVHEVYAEKTQADAPPPQVDVKL
jgi:hypothetical protein